jgi:hypothetical protein
VLRLTELEALGQAAECLRTWLIRIDCGWCRCYCRGSTRWGFGPGV